MTMCSRGTFMLAIVVAAAMPVVAQTLNPTVTLLPEPARPVPADCVDPGATPVQRAQIEPAPVPAPVRPDPQPEMRLKTAPRPVERGDVRSELRAAHAAALARDRASYDAALVHARSLGAPGDVLSLFDDITRLWDYQLTAPSGSFFDASGEGGALLRSLTKHRGYEDFVRRQTVTDASGTRFYPTRESIEFLLARIGEQIGTAEPRSQRTTETRAPEPAPTLQRPAPAPQPDQRLKVPAATEKPRRSTTARRRMGAKRVAPAPSKAASQAAARTAVEEPPMPSGVVAAQPPAPTETTATTTAQAVPMATATETQTPPTDTVATTEAAPAADTATEPAAARQPERRRSIIWPLVLILIGIGVLILLFRASS